MKLSIFLIFFLSIGYLFLSADGMILFEIDKENYFSGDILFVNGQVEVVSEAQQIANVVISSPHTPFVGIIPATILSDGTFSDSMITGGPTWSYEGTYLISVTYYGETVEDTFEFMKTPPETLPATPPETLPATPPETLPATPPETLPATTESKIETIQTQKPKTHIPGFPSLDKSPQYYIERYHDEENYKDWFDSQFPGKVISKVVGYEQTHIPGFPELDKSPQYYIDRYNNEQTYKDWFDSQFPNKSIYNVLGFPDPVAIPDWIKDIAEWWSTGEIDDDTFVSGIEYMIENNIIIIPNLPESKISEDNSVPFWVRNNANWWALDRISEEEFVNAIKFLVEKGIIIV